MTVYYEVSKCKYIAFIKDLKYVEDRMNLQSNTTYLLGFDKNNELNTNSKPDIENIISKSKYESESEDIIKSISDDLDENNDENNDIDYNEDESSNGQSKENIRELKNIEDIKSINDDHFILVINAESELFSDVNFEINQDKIGESSKTGNKTQDVCRDVLLGGSQQLEAFSNSKFTIIPGKRNAGIQSCHPKQNHDVIDSIARNGLMVTPLTSTQFSIGQLFNILVTKKSFDIIILHSKLEVSIRDSTYPGDYVEPAYIVGQGEISTVFYRYICLYFFGYTSVSNENDRDRIYDL